LCGARSAAAQPSKEDVAKADTLFREAQGLIQKGQFPEACAKFTESQKLDPANGTLLNMAFCHDKEGKYATEFRELQELLGNISGSKNPDDKERTRVAKERLKVLDAKISRVTFDVSEVPRDAAITLDGEKLTDPSLPQLVDPGSHAVEATLPPKKPSKKSFDVSAPGPMTVKLDPLQDDVPPPPPPPVEKPAPPPPPQEGGFWSGRRVLGAVVGGVGVAGVGLGIGFGLYTFNQKALRDANCQGTVCNNVGIFYHQQAQQAATVSTIGFVGGTVLLGVGAVLFITAPRKAPADGATTGVSFGVGPRGAVMLGRF
jgi:hypothetical protein